MAKLSKLYTKKQIDEIRNDLIAKHGNICAICKKPRSAFKKNFSVDHRHTDDKIRGLLCFRCNRFLVGRFTLNKILPVVDYLIKYELGDKACEKHGRLLLDLKTDTQ